MSHVERQSRRRRIALSWLLCGCMAWPVAAQQVPARASDASAMPAYDQNTVIPTQTN